MLWLSLCSALPSLLDHGDGAPPCKAMLITGGGRETRIALKLAIKCYTLEVVNITAPSLTVHNLWNGITKLQRARTDEMLS